MPPTPDPVPDADPHPGSKRGEGPGTALDIGQPTLKAAPVVGIVAPPDLAALEPDWAALWMRCPSVTPFGHPSWLMAWARHHAPGRRAAVTLHDGGRLVALIPVFCWEGALLLAGTGPSDRGEVLVEPGYRDQVPRLLAALPEAAPEPFDRIDLQQIPGDFPLSDMIPSGWSEERLEGDPCLVAPLVGDNGLGAVSGRQRSHWRHALRQLERQGGAVGLAPDEDVPEAVEDLLALNAKRWGAESVLADPLLRALLRDAGPALARDGLLRLHQVTLRGRRIAVLFVLAGHWAHHGYNGGFDPEHAQLSPSAILVGCAMAQAAREGRAQFDFLRGGEGYKRVWGAEPMPMQRRILRPTGR